MHARLFIPAVILSPLVGAAQDQCRDILTNGFYNEYSMISDQARDQTMFAELCASNFQQAQNVVKRAQQSGAGGSLGVSYGLFSLSGGGQSSSGSSFSEAQFNQWKNQSCSKHSSSDSSRAAEYLMQKTVAESVVNAWAACMQNKEGLACWAAPYHNEVLLNVSWKKTSMTQPNVSTSYLSKGSTSQLDGAPAGRLFPSSSKLNPGVLQIPIIRSQMTSIVASLNIAHDGVSHSCNVFVPGEQDFALSKSTLPQQLVRSPEKGCSAQAAPLGKDCSDSWTYESPVGYKVCTVELRYNSGPTSGARVSLVSPSQSSGTVRWEVSRNETPFGAGRWVFGTATVTYVPTDRNSRDDSRACAPTTLANQE